MRLIDANELDVDGYFEEFPIGEYDYGWNAALQVIKNRIKAQDTIDAVQVVRCKDCKHWERNVGVVDSPNGYCWYTDDVMNGFDYCSYGEREDDEKA